MKFIKYGFLRMKSKWVSVWLTLLAYTLLFSLCFGAMTLYSTASAQTEFLQSSLGRSVTLRRVRYTIATDSGKVGFGTPFDLEELDAFLYDERVEGRNYCTMYVAPEFPEQEILYREERNEMLGRPYSEGYLFFVNENGMAGMAMVDSARSPMFLIGGLQLIEGEHFTESETENVCLISEGWANLNDISVGDILPVKRSIDRGEQFELQMRVAGIFSSPDSDNWKGIGSRPEELVLFPLCVYEAMEGDADIETAYATVYLKEGTDIDAFVADMQKELNIRYVRESHYDYTFSEPPPEEYSALSYDEIAEKLNEEPVYDVVIDREWYDMVAKPIEQVTALARVMMILFAGASLLLFVLLAVLSMKGREREMGIFLSMGASKFQVLLQLAVELIIPLIIALGLGVAVGNIAGVPLAENLCNGVYAQSAADLQSSNESVTYGSEINSWESFDIYAASYQSYFHNGIFYDVNVYPKAEAKAGTAAFMLFAALAASAAVLITLAQGIMLLRLKPAKILTGKK